MYLSIRSRIMEGWQCNISFTIADMNGQPENLARCGYCDYISYESTVKEHVKLVHDANDITSNNNNIDYDEESVIDEFNESSATDRMVVVETSNTHHWSDSEIKLLISLYTDYRQDLDGKKLTNKSIWQKIALEMNKNDGCTVTWEQCDNKFKNLKKAYKKVIDNNSKSGRGKMSFKYFDLMDLLFCKNPEIHPVAECSSMETPRSMESFNEPQSPVSSVSGTATPVPDEPPGIAPKRGKSLKRIAEEEPTWFTKFREDAERRHREKMAVQERFISVFERLLEK